jgi:putative addiction module component (TIGR02574 family)
MSMTFAELTEQALRLSPSERARLVQKLLESLQEPTMINIAAEWEREIKERVACFDRDGSTFSTDEMFADVRRSNP